MRYQVTQYLEPWDKDFFEFFDKILGIDQARGRGKDPLQGRDGPHPAAEKRRFTPRCDVVETETQYQYFVDLPGMNKDEIAIEIKENNLHISGEKRFDHGNGSWEAEERGEGQAGQQGPKFPEAKRIHTERPYGHFYRVLPVDPKSKVDQIDAHYENGLLTITIPKGDQTQSRKIVINSH